MQRYTIGFLMLLACAFVEVSLYPASNNEESSLNLEINHETSKNAMIEERSLPVEIPIVQQDANTKEILEKIKAINEGIKKPYRRQQIKWNPQPQTGGGYIMDKEILEKLQEIISSGKLHGLPHQDNYNHDAAENTNDIRYSRQMTYPSNLLPISPYVMNMPVIVIPGGMNPNYMNVNNFNKLRDGYEGQGESPFQWNLAQFFPILIRDPLLSIMNGGGWSNFIEYGQSADICRKQKSIDENIKDRQIEENVKANLQGELFQRYIDLNPITETMDRQSRSLKKRTVSQEAQPEIDNNKNNKKTITKKPTTTRRPIFSIQQLQQLVDPGSKDDVRFGWFSGNNDNNNANNDNVDQRKPVGVPTPGFFINRLRVRKGGVAIAGPGGVATAGRGGTAIVGPGGTALTQPGGVAVAGPAARVIALSPDADLSSIIKNLQQQQADSDEREWRRFDGSYTKSWQWNDYGRRADEFQYDGKSFIPGPLKFGKSNFRLILKPTANAQIGSGTAIANPVSQVVVAKNTSGSIVHNPVASAVAGPGGIAHYLPFYGGAKGQYLEIKKDSRGTVTSEKIVPEDKLSTDNTKYGDDENENLLIRILVKNLYNLKRSSSDLLKVVNVGRKTGNLNNQDKSKFKTQISALAEAVSNIIKVTDDIGDDVNSLFKNNKSNSHDRCSPQHVGEEGIGVDAEDSGGYDDDSYDQGLVAEAKPVGLAVVGEHGLAASRPIGTAVAASGVAIARPVGTAIAGINPAALGINYQFNNLRKHKIN
ncbi:hypothetical protein K1T71_004738 [Dendrolimus kikuchii]|uniref:Uncharacterized protein n=1 Tax=Dendrolimus kikuchii TaxID=765133 RepID=A0ACC1D9A8_9NEOP|nr:hypothetical protein K1T71_004738 [Dendrolimus kikuchii]